MKTTFEHVKEHEQFTNGTGCTFVKTGERSASIIESPDYPQLVGALYSFGLYNSVEVEKEEGEKNANQV